MLREYSIFIPRPPHKGATGIVGVHLKPKKAHFTRIVLSALQAYSWAVLMGSD